MPFHQPSSFHPHITWPFHQQQVAYGFETLDESQPQLSSSASTASSVLFSTPPNSLTDYIPMSNNGAAWWTADSTADSNLVVGQDMVSSEAQHGVHSVEQAVFEQPQQHASNGTETSPAGAKPMSGQFASLPFEDATAANSSIRMHRHYHAFPPSGAVVGPLTQTNVTPEMSSLTLQGQWTSQTLESHLQQPQQQPQQQQPLSSIPHMPPPFNLTALLRDLPLDVTAMTTPGGYTTTPVPSLPPLATATEVTSTRAGTVVSNASSGTTKHSPTAMARHIPVTRLFHSEPIIMPSSVDILSSSPLSQQPGEGGHGSGQNVSSISADRAAPVSEPFSSSLFAIHANLPLSPTPATVILGDVCIFKFPAAPAEFD
ncbi:hypothetical protein BGZ96_000560 [Linnemannia gamsii]|uniref:Uncharacterized protein n=1 Tax=Linnemannia gamsii TaxID=64522 RepID=A0ABQ7KBB4_9FUNG|nr:hypothetical protein BGZ96_000560 [Linnemannia gamsii]